VNLTAKPAPKRRVFSAERIREFLQQSSQQFCDVLLSDPARGKQEIQLLVNLSQPGF
jgi:hypothetical protein